MKNKIRKDFKQKTFEMSDIEKSAADDAICNFLSRLPDIEDAKTIAVYAAIDHEVDLSRIAVQMLKHKKCLCLPRSKKNKTGIIEYEMAMIANLGDLQEGRFGILEPSSTCPSCDKNKIDIWLVPGLAFAVDGTRLGRGGGVYDRLLQNATGKKIGVLYQNQLLELLPCEAHDIKMDMLITEQQIINFSNHNE